MTYVAASGTDARTVQPCAPAAPQFQDCEALARQVDGAKSSAPFSDIRVPVCRDRSVIYLSSLISKKAGEEAWVDQNPDEASEVAGLRWQGCDCVPIDNFDWIEARVVVPKRATVRLNLRLQTIALI